MVKILRSIIRRWLRRPIYEIEIFICIMVDTFLMRCCCFCCWCNRLFDAIYGRNCFRSFLGLSSSIKLYFWFIWVVALSQIGHTIPIMGVEQRLIKQCSRRPVASTILICKSLNKIDYRTAIILAFLRSLRCLNYNFSQNQDSCVFIPFEYQVI